MTNLEHTQRAVLKALASTFYSTHIIDLQKNQVTEYSSRNEITVLVKKTSEESGGNAIYMMDTIIDTVVDDAEKYRIKKLTDLRTLPKRMKDVNMLSFEFIGKNRGWMRASFVVAERNAQGFPTSVLFITTVIDEEKKKEEKLLIESNRDELTELYNRNAYERDIQLFEEELKSKELTYITADLNGLKFINDNYGHLEGDEVIKGAAFCMRSSLERYGKVYRLGGDEFAAFIRPMGKIDEIIRSLKMSFKTWRSSSGTEIHMSIGYVSRSEFPSKSLTALIQIADRRMYDAKEAYYRKTGTDRRGQLEVYNAFASVCVKILKINLTEDSFEIVKVNVEEQVQERGYADKISSWFKNFGIKGEVHMDDLNTYLRQTDIKYLDDYFSKDNLMMSMRYRRKSEQGYKLVEMEFIKAPDFTLNNKTLYLYVKRIN